MSRIIDISFFLVYIYYRRYREMESNFNDKDMNDIDYFTTIGQKNEVNKAVDNTEKRINNSKESASRRKSMTKEKIRAREKLI